MSAFFRKKEWHADLVPALPVCQFKEKDHHSNVNNKRICKDGPVFWQRRWNPNEYKVNIAELNLRIPVMVASEHLVQVQNMVNL